IRFCLAGLVSLTALPALTAEDTRPAAGSLPPKAGGTVDFARDIQPILAAKCLSCHDTAKERGGLRLDDGELAMKGGDSGPVMVPGKSGESRLVKLVAGLDPELKMPPKGTGLSREEIGKLRSWIDQGAKWPKQSPTAASKPTSSHWAFQPRQRPTPPLTLDP